jgi:hypothetical protein
MVVPAECARDSSGQQGVRISLGEMLEPPDVGCYKRGVLLASLFVACGLLFGAPAMAAGRVDLTRLQCGNLIYAGNKSSVCFSDKFLSDVARDTSLNVGRSFCPVKLDADGLFDYPFCVFSGNESFTLTQKERDNLRKYVSDGGFILASPGCSDEKWDAAFRRELKLCFPESKLTKIPMSHPVFSAVNKLTRLTDKHGNPVMLEGLEINGRLAVVYSKEGLNDVAHAEGCCCCGGNEIADPAKVNVNIFTYALLY